MNLIAVFLFHFAASTHPLAIFSPQVIPLGASSFNQNVTSTWVVLYFAPWCRYCKEFIPVFSRVAASSHTGLRFGVVNCETEIVFCYQQNVRQYPTVVYYNGKQVMGEMNLDLFESQVKNLSNVSVKESYTYLVSLIFYIAIV